MSLVSEIEKYFKVKVEDDGNKLVFKLPEVMCLLEIKEVRKDCTELEYELYSERTRFRNSYKQEVILTKVSNPKYINLIMLEMERDIKMFVELDKIS